MEKEFLIQYISSGSSTFLWGRVVSALGAPSAPLPDLEEEIPCIPEAVGLPPEGLDHVVRAFDGAVRDVEHCMGHNAAHPPFEHPPHLFKLGDSRGFDHRYELLQRQLHDLGVPAGKSRLQHLPEHIGGLDPLVGG